VERNDLAEALRADDERAKGLRDEKARKQPTAKQAPGAQAPAPHPSRRLPDPDREEER
jgi:hypothetical protein